MLPRIGVIDLPSRQINDFFTKRKQKKIEIVGRPAMQEEREGGLLGQAQLILEELELSFLGAEVGSVVIESELSQGNRLAWVV